MKIKRLILIIFFICFQTQIFAFTEEEALVRFQNRMTNFETLTGTMVWTTELGITYIGSLQYINPGKIYIKITSPQNSIFVSNGRKIWLYDPENKICSIQNLDDKFSGGVSSLTKGYTLSDLQETSDGFSFQLDNKGNFFPKLLVMVDKTFFLKKIVFITKQEKETSLTIINPKTTESIREKIFSFNVPANTQVVKNPLDIK